VFPLKGLVIDAPHIDNILAGRKRWEMRPCATRERGPIALIRKGSGLVVGTANLADCIGPLTDYELRAAEPLHRIAAYRLRSAAAARHNHAWILEDVRRLPVPIPYRHPPGAVTWVSLHQAVMQAMESVSMA
jgi:hypothetical protein